MQRPQPLLYISYSSGTHHHDMFACMAAGKLMCAYATHDTSSPMLRCRVRPVTAPPAACPATRCRPAWAAASGRARRAHPAQSPWRSSVRGGMRPQGLHATEMSPNACAAKVCARMGPITAMRPASQFTAWAFRGKAVKGPAHQRTAGLQGSPAASQSAAPAQRCPSPRQRPAHPCMFCESEAALVCLRLLRRLLQSAPCLQAQECLAEALRQLPRTQVCPVRQEDSCNRPWLRIE